MSYKVAVRPDGRDEVPVKVDVKNFKIEEHYEGGICVELEYAKSRLLQWDPAGAKAVLGAWPTVDELVLYREGDGDQYEEVFAGVVTKVDTDDHEVIIAAHMADVVPPNPLTVDVQEDTDDTTRMSVIVRTDNDGQGTVALSYGDGATASNPGDGASGSQHVYASPGSYTVTATSDSDPARTALQTVTVPYTA